MCPYCLKQAGSWIQTLSSVNMLITESLSQLGFAYLKLKQASSIHQSKESEMRCTFSVSCFSCHKQTILFQDLQIPPRQTDRWSETVDINSHNVKFQLTFISLTFSCYIQHAYPHCPPQRCLNKPKEMKVMAKLTSRHLDVACCGYFPASMLTFPCPRDRGGKIWGGGGEHGECLGIPSTALRAESRCEPPCGLSLRKTRKPRR